VLLGKVALVAAAAGAGAYNHKVLIPRMMRLSPNDPAADAEFRRTVTLEGGAMGSVILLTAVLVASAS
jgi:putative copper export protein